MPLGTCKLCLQPKELQDSHYLPRSVYKSNRARELKNQNPIIFGASVRQDQGQVTDYVFCADCEQRFNKYGEGWVLGKIPHDYGTPFGLQDALEKETPFHIEPGLNLYAGAKISAFDMDKLVYFAASIFWRGAVHEWKTDRGELTPKVELGNHEEPLRKFLLGEGPLPPDVWITTIVWPFKKILNVGFVPAPAHTGDWHRYWFYVSGLGFILHFGSSVPPEVKQRCSDHSPERVITVEQDFGDMVVELVKKMVRESDTSGLHDMLREIGALRSKQKPT
jgi:hypothetical protein